MTERTSRRVHESERRGEMKGDERERKRAVSVDGRLLRPCSRSFPLNSSASGGGERPTRGGRVCGRMESQDDARESDGGRRRAGVA